MPDISKLLELLKSDNPNVVKSALLALGYLKKEISLKNLLPFIKHKHWQLREAAVKAIERLELKEAVDYLFQRLDIVKETGRKIILDLLTSKKIPQEEEDNKKVETHPRVKRAIAYAIANIDKNYLINPLINSLNSENINMKIAAVNGLGNIRNPIAVKPLLEIINTDNINLLQAIIVALGKIKSEEPVDKLIELSSHKSEIIRKEVIIALNHIKSPKGVQVFKERLTDDSVEVRKTAVIALGNTRDDAVLPLLLKMAKDKSWQVRKAVASSLINYRNEDSIQQLIEFLNDENEDVVNEASLVFNKLYPLVVEK